MQPGGTLGDCESGSGKGHLTDDTAVNDDGV